MISEEFRELISKERKARNATLLAFAKEVGVTERAIAYWETGQRSHKDLDRLEAVLNKLNYELVIRPLPKEDE